ncbi:MAG: response regulator [Nitrospirae bacterium]|nr:response regulator [Nitrospirota bacterium]
MPKKILIVEDNESNSQLLYYVLKHQGHEIIEAKDGKEGIKKAEEYMPDLIFMDLQLPLLDGFTAIKMLKNDPKTKHIKIIALTAFAMKGDKEMIIETGADDYIAKPIDTRRLIEIIDKF